jgi:1-acyl-sn-glycerol-3-phosphate acyltransferase
VRLACATGALIVPVVHNAGKVWPAKGWPVGGGDIRVVIGPTLSPAERSPQELSHQVHDWMQAELLKL